MNYLLDTHALLWWLSEDSKLPQAVREALEKPLNEVYVSAAAAWEIAIKQASGKLEAPYSLSHALLESGFQELPITFAHAKEAGALPPHHQDPFDRMMIAQARLHLLTLITKDKVISEYDVPVFW